MFGHYESSVEFFGWNLGLRCVQRWQIIHRAQCVDNIVTYIACATLSTKKSNRTFWPNVSAKFKSISTQDQYVREYIFRSDIEDVVSNSTAKPRFIDTFVYYFPVFFSRFACQSLKRDNRKSGLSSSLVIALRFGIKYVTPQRARENSGYDSYE